MTDKKVSTARIRAEGFTVKSTMKNSVVVGPQAAGAYKEHPVRSSTFRKLYDSGELPIAMVHNNMGNGIRWKVPLESLDYQHYLHLFFDGLSEKTHPYELLARLGVHEMLQHGKGKILPAIRLLIAPIRSGLNTRVPQVMCNMMKALQQLVVSEERVGEALVPHFKQILPIFRIFKDKNANSGDCVDYSQRNKRTNVADLIQETLVLFELHGGDDAFIHIKHTVPTYESRKIN